MMLIESYNLDNIIQSNILIIIYKLYVIIKIAESRL